jgi:hypothetical protein
LQTTESSYPSYLFATEDALHFKASGLPAVQGSYQVDLNNTVSLVTNDPLSGIIDAVFFNGYYYYSDFTADFGYELWKIGWNSNRNFPGEGYRVQEQQVPVRAS